MTYVFGSNFLSVRADLRSALDLAYKHIGETGDWLTGAQRVSVYAEMRQAWDCQLCRDLKAELSPYNIRGKHDTLGELPEAWVDVIHRVTTDPGRLSERWFQEALTGGMEEDEIIEVINVCVQAIAIDVFTSGIGLSLPSLPATGTGEPLRRRPSEAKTGPGWAATIAPEDVGDDFADFYDGDRHFYIRRSLTLVPGECRRLWHLLNSLYIEDPRITELEGVERGISRAQMEFLAARASALLGCYY